MRKIILLSLLASFYISCEKDSGIQDMNTESVLLETLETPDQIFSFLGTEMPERFTPELVAEMKENLNSKSPLLHSRSGKVVHLLEGSENALEQAVQDAGPGGRVIVDAGMHKETGWVTIKHRITIEGEEGAVVVLENPLLPDLPGELAGGILIHGGDNSVIRGIRFEGNDAGAGSGIIVRSGDRIAIADNSFSNIQFPITIDRGDYGTIRDNELELNLAWTEFPAGSTGITVINGKNTYVIDNVVSGALFGIFISGKGVINWGNTSTYCVFGQIICNFFGANYPDGTPLKAEVPGNHGLYVSNNNSENFYAGILVIDGANHNVLLANKGANNAVVDMDLVGDSERFGFFTPTCWKNRVYSFADQTIKDCGDQNRINGGILLDDATLPCDQVGG